MVRGVTNTAGARAGHTALTVNFLEKNNFHFPWPNLIPNLASEVTAGLKVFVSETFSVWFAIEGDRQSSCEGMSFEHSQKREEQCSLVTMHRDWIFCIIG